MREVREYGKSIDPPTSKEEGDMRIEIWTIREEHLVFEKVDGYNFTDRERFLAIRRGIKLDYLPGIDIRRITVQEDPKSRGENRGHNRRH